jgi:hypothetical protein
MARTNYSYEKRLRELEKQKKKQLKREKKQGKLDEQSSEEAETVSAPEPLPEDQKEFTPEG